MHALGWLRCAVLAVVAPAVAAAQTEIEQAPLPLAAPTGWVVTSDNLTLIVSQPKSAELIYFDSVTEEEQKRVSLDFAPGPMVLRGESLFVAGDGTALIYELDAVTGESKREFTVPAAGVTGIDCHPTIGLIYAATATYDVFSLDAETGRVVETGGVGNRVLVSRQSPTTVFTGVLRNDVKDVFYVRTRGRQVRIIWDEWGPRSGILKYKATGAKLTIDNVQENATINAYEMFMTQDGNGVMITGGGGWRPPAESPGQGGGYFTAVFSATNIQALVGKAPHASNIAFHPVLRLAVANHIGRDLHLFDPKSYAVKNTLHVANGADMRPLLLTFVAKGTKIALWNGDNPANPREGLYFIPLELSDADRELLVTAYGELPAAAEPTLARGESPAATPAGPPVSEPEPKDGPKMPPTGKAPLLARATTRPAADDLKIVSGFNDRTGLASDSKPGSPFRLGSAAVTGGVKEPGWRGAWPADPKAVFQSKVVFEGDGALHLTGTINYAREFARPLQGRVELEYAVQVPADSNLVSYIWQSNYADAGPTWQVTRGRFLYLDGDESGGGTNQDIGVACEPGKWYRVVINIDTAARRWRLDLPDEGYESPEIRYRGKPERLQQINFLTEHPDGAYVDAIQARPVTAPPNAAR